MFGSLTSSLSNQLISMLETPALIGPKIRSLNFECDSEISQKKSLQRWGAIKPVLQMAQFCQTLNLKQYQNAYCSANPEGNRIASYNLKTLIDPIPCFQKTYIPSINSLEKMYGQLIGCAVSNSPMTQKVLADARKAYDQAAQASLSGIPSDTWRIVETDPVDWWDISNKKRFRDITLDLQNGSGNAFTILDGNDTLTLNVGDGAEESFNFLSTLRSVSFRGQLVALKRSWLNFSLLCYPDLQLTDFPPGFFSTGQIKNNSGFLSLIPTHVLIGYDASLDIQWAVSDMKRLEGVHDRPVSLGPFPLSFPQHVEDGNTPTLFVAAVISQLTPMLPGSVSIP